MTHIRPLGQGEVLKPGGPASGEVTIVVDPRQAGTPVVSGTRTLLRGEMIPAQRHLQYDQVWFVHKGQGRAIIEAEAATVVPGSVVAIPKGAWHELRNTGTGALQIVWTAAPPGLEEFYRELARRGDTAASGSLQEIAQRYGIEFRPDAAAAAAAASAPGSRHRRRWRGGRGRGPSTVGLHQQGSPPQAPVAASAPRPSSVPSGQGPRRPRRRAGSRQAPQPVGSQRPASKEPRQQRGGRRHFSHVKEVYMGGRWIRVSGEGPVVAPGRERSRGPQEGVTKDDTPPGPLSVSL